jgi:hypothetical protein
LRWRLFERGKRSLIPNCFTKNMAQNSYTEAGKLQKYGEISKTLAADSQYGKTWCGIKTTLINIQLHKASLCTRFWPVPNVRDQKYKKTLFF